MQIRSASRSGTVWAAVGAIASFVTALAPAVPSDYRELALAVGGVFSAVAALRARKAGIDAARGALEANHNARRARRSDPE